MKLLCIVLIVIISCPNCSTITTQITERPPLPTPFDDSSYYSKKIASEISKSLSKGDDLFDYWLAVLPLSFNQYFDLNDDWMVYLESKSKEYRDVEIPKYNRLLYGAINQSGGPPKYNSPIFLIAELSSIPASKPAINEVVGKLAKLEKDFYSPIFKRANAESERTRNNIKVALQTDQPFHKTYNSILYLAKWEAHRLDKIDSLYKQYQPIIASYIVAWKNSLNQKQLDLFKAGVTDNRVTDKFVRSLNTPQLVAYMRIVTLLSFINNQRIIFTSRYSDLVKLSTWLKENKETAQGSLKEREEKRANLLALAGFMLGFGAALIASRPQPVFESYNVFLQSPRGPIMGTVSGFSYK